MARVEHPHTAASGKDPLERQVRIVTGFTILLVTAIAFVFEAEKASAAVPKVPLAFLFVGAIAVAGAAFLPAWNRWPRDAFGIIIAAQAILLGTYLYSTGMYHPWHAYWMLIAVLAGAHLSRTALAILTSIIILTSLSPLTYSAFFQTSPATALNYWVEIPGYVVAASVTHLLFSRLRARRLETLEYADEARRYAAAMEQRNIHLQGLYKVAETMAASARATDACGVVAWQLPALVGTGVVGVGLALPRALLKIDAPADGGDDAHTEPCIEHLLKEIPEQQRQALETSEVMLSAPEDVGPVAGFLSMPDADKLLLLPVDGPAGLLGVACVGLQGAEPDANLRSVLTTFRSLLRGTLLGFHLRDEMAETEAAKRAAALKMEFVSTVSHELRTPLTAILGFSELVGVRSDVGPTSQRDVQRIHDSAVHMQDIVSDLHELSIMEAGRLTMSPVSMDLRPLTQEMVEEFGRTSDKHQVFCDVPEAIPHVLADASRVRQVLSNLITNAIKYSPQGGEVRILARPDNGMVLVEVRDQGLGIPPEETERIFDRFYRIKDGRHSVRGTGLGLSICRQIVEGHGGHIWAHSEPGHGSAFRFTLPRA